MKIFIKFFFFIPIFLFYLNSYGQSLVSNDYNLSSNYIESVFYDISGKLWIGTDEGLNLITSHDQYQFLASISNDNGLINDEYTTDGVHLNEKGYNVWVKTIKPLFNTFN